jgi:hypothetical protein
MTCRISENRWLNATRPKPSPGSRVEAILGRGGFLCDGHVAPALGIATEQRGSGHSGHGLGFRDHRHGSGPRILASPSPSTHPRPGLPLCLLVLFVVSLTTRRAAPTILTELTWATPPWPPGVDSLYLLEFELP